MRVYVAGPYRADTESGVNHNIEAARKVAEHLWSLGHFALCPHLNSAFMGGICDDEQFLLGGLDFLKGCDALVLVDGRWQESYGTLEELRVARDSGIPCYLTVGDFVASREMVFA